MEHVCDNTEIDPNDPALEFSSKDRENKEYEGILSFLKTTLQFTTISKTHPWKEIQIFSKSFLKVIKWEMKLFGH